MSAPPRPASTISSHAFAVLATRSSQTLPSWTAAARNVPAGLPSVAMAATPLVGALGGGSASCPGRPRPVRSPRRDPAAGAGPTAPRRVADRPGPEEVVAHVVAERRSRPGAHRRSGQVAVGHRDALLPVGHRGDGAAQRIDDVAATAVRPPRPVLAARGLARRSPGWRSRRTSRVQRVRDAQLAVLLEMHAVRPPSTAASGRSTARSGSPRPAGRARGETAAGGSRSRCRRRGWPAASGRCGCPRARRG